MYSITEPTMWFLTTVEERNSTGVPRLRMLPGQYVPKEEGGFERANDATNVQSDVKPRSDNAIGTIFVTKVLKKDKTASGTPFYATGSGNLTAMNRGVSGDISDAYKLYAAAAGAPSMEFEPGAAPATPGALKVETLIEKLLKKCPCPTVAADNFYVRPDLWRALLFNVQQGYNTMLMGESGTGKTELTMILSKALEKGIKIFDMAAKQDPIASLVGVHRFDGGKSIFDRADFTHAIEQEGIIVLDELPRAPMNTNNILFPVLDSRRELNMDIASAELRTIKVNPGCRFIATANEGFKYTGNNVLDQALKERFQILVIDFMPEDQEVSLLVKRTGLDKKMAQTIVKTCTTIRTLANKDELSNGVSIRHSLYAADLNAGGFTTSEALEVSLLPMFTIPEERKKVKDLLAAR